MAEAGPLDQMGKSASDLAHQLERGHKASEGMNLSLSRIVALGVGYDAIKTKITQIIHSTETWQRLDKAFTLEGMVRAGITKTEIALLGTAAAAGATLYENERSLNQNLIEANSSYQNRSRLLQETLVTQAQLGASFGEITKAAAALVHYGLETESTFNDNLRLVVQMEQGLGVSAQHSAQLATIVERQLKGSFTDVAHVVAQLVNDTALAGDEAIRLGNAIATAMGRLRPGLGAQGLPEVLRLVGRYESALKEVGGAPGAFQQLVTSLTKPEGIVGAGALGVSPEFLATEHGVQQVMDRFANYGQMLVGQAQGWERQFRLQMLAEVFNTTADAANQMLIAIQRTKAEQVGAITLQDRWREQMHATNMGLSRLGNSLMALLQGAMYPVVQLVGFLANKLADLTEWLLKSKEVVYGVGVALFAGSVVLTISLWNLVRALYAAATASTVAAVTQRVGVLSSFTSWAAFSNLMITQGRAFWGGLLAMKTSFDARLAFGGLRAAGALPIFGGLMASLALWLAPLAFAAIMLYKIYNINKKSQEDQLMAQKIIISKQDALEANRRAKIYGAVRSGRSEEEIVAIYAGLARDAAGKFAEIADPVARRAAQKAWLEEQRGQVEMDVLKAVTTAGMFTPLTERTPEQKVHEDAMRNISEKLLKVNEKQEVTLDKGMKRSQEAIQDEQIERAKTRAWRNPLDTAGDYWIDLFSPKK